VTPYLVVFQGKTTTCSAADRRNYIKSTDRKVLGLDCTRLTGQLPFWQSCWPTVTVVRICYFSLFFLSLNAFPCYYSVIGLSCSDWDQIGHLDGRRPAPKLHNGVFGRPWS